MPMKAQLLHTPAPIAAAPLTLTDLEHPSPAADELLLRVQACGVCHTDLHIVEGDLAPRKLPIIPGHEVIGSVEALGAAVTRFEVGDRVGAAWLHRSDRSCFYCRHDQENLCEAADFTGYTVNGGYAEYMTIPADFAVPIPDVFSDLEAAPLLCAGIVGYRSLRLSDVQPGERLGIFGFGASGHICLQVARHWGCEVYVFTRSPDHQRHALALGAAWAGEANDMPPKSLDRAIIFAPAGWIVPLALERLRKGGTLCINAIHMSDLPAMPYHLLWHERTIRSVANAARRDAEEFMPLAAQIPIQTTVQAFDLDEANHVLNLMKTSQITGAAVLRI